MWRPGQEVKVAPTKRGTQVIRGEVHGPSFVFSGSRGNIPGGGRGGAPGSSQILVSLIAFGEISLSHYLEADELFLIGQNDLFWGGFIFDGQKK